MIEYDLTPLLEGGMSLPMVMPKRGHVRMIIYVPPEFKEEARQECKRRKLTYGQLFQESYSQRVRLVRR